LSRNRLLYCYATADRQAGKGASVRPRDRFGPGDVQRSQAGQGIQNDTLFDSMKEEIEEGRQHFKSRVTPEIAATNLFDRALVDILLKQRGQNIKSKIW
jgi:hypothetical protein